MSSSYIKIFLLSRQLAYEVSHEGSPAMASEKPYRLLAAQKRIGPLEPGRELIVIKPSSKPQVQLQA